MLRMCMVWGHVLHISTANTEPLQTKVRNTRDLILLGKGVPVPCYVFSKQPLVLLLFLVLLSFTKILL